MAEMVWGREGEDDCCYGWRIIMMMLMMMVITRLHRSPKFVEYNFDEEENMTMKLKEWCRITIMMAYNASDCNLHKPAEH